MQRYLWRNISAVILTLIAGLTMGDHFSGRPVGSPRTLTIGVDNAPPYHTIQPDGAIRGLAVDILTEAARRKNIRLVWVPVDSVKMDTALAEGVVDLWPALSRTPARDKVLHFSKPWLESNYCLLSRSSAEITREATQGITLGVAVSPRVTALAARFFPRALRQPMRSNLDVVRAVCEGSTTAGFLEARTLDSVLLDRPQGCESASLRVHFVSEAANPVSMAGLPAKADLIDDLRDGISPLIADGTFANALDRWSGFSGAQTRAYFDLREAQTRAELYSYGVVLLLVAGAVLVCMVRSQVVSHRKTRQASSAVADSEARFDAFMDHSPMVAFVKDEAGRLIYANQKFRDIFGPLVGEYLGKTDFDLWPHEAAGKIRADDLKVVGDWQSAEILDSVPGDGGENRTWLSMKFPFRMHGRAYLGGLSADITEREQAKEAMRVSKAQFQMAFDHAVIGIAMTDMSGHFLKVNPAFCHITGYSFDEALEMDYTSISHPDDLELSENMRQATLAAGGSVFRLDKRYVRKDGSAVWVGLNVGIVRDHNGQPCHYIALVEDITPARLAEEVAMISEQRWQLALNGSTDGIWDWNARDNTVFYSARYKEMLGYDDTDLPNRPDVWEHLLHPKDRAGAREAVQAHLDRLTPTYTAEYRLRCKDGSYKWVLARGTAIWDATGAPVRLIGTHTDITERKHAQERLIHDANHDPLTGLANRRFFLSRLEADMREANEAGTSLCLCACDLDRFKGINDSEGHQVGDQVLRGLAGVFTEVLRSGDLVGRMGGDEFCVLLPQTTAHEALACMERVKARLEAISFSGSKGNSFRASASFGVSQMARDASAADLIEATDRALYAAKRVGRNAAHADIATELSQLAHRLGPDKVLEEADSCVI